MTERTETESNVDDGEDRPILPWEVLEVVAIVVLIAVGALVLGGLVAGILFSTQIGGPVPVPVQFTGQAIEFGSTWAEPLRAIVLLGVVGISWWQAEAWANGGEDGQFDQHAARGHIGRAHRIGLVAQIALLVTVAGSIATLVGVFLAVSGSGAEGWAREALASAELVGILAISAGGLWIGRRARAVGLGRTVS